MYIYSSISRQWSHVTFHLDLLIWNFNCYFHSLVENIFKLYIFKIFIAQIWFGTSQQFVIESRNLSFVFLFLDDALATSTVPCLLSRRQFISFHLRRYVGWCYRMCRLFLGKYATLVVLHNAIKSIRKSNLISIRYLFFQLSQWESDIYLQI